MPWCEECAKYWTPNAMHDDGTCPRCGDALVEPRDRPASPSDGDVEEQAPWHFKLMVVAVVAYLVWRFVQIFA